MTVPGLSFPTELAGGQSVAGSGIPNGTTIVTVNTSNGTVTLSKNATANGYMGLTATNPSNTPETTTSAIPISGDPSLTVSSLEITVTSLIYPTDSNLTLTLTSPPTAANPSGVSVILYQNSSDKGQNFTNTTFSDSATQSISSAKAPYTGTFIPLHLLSAFNGLQAVGNWTLSVSGGIGPHGGILQSWSLSINGVASKPTAFDVTFDRPIDPQALISAGQATFTPGDIEVFYHDTTNGDASIPLMVTGVTPIVPPYYVNDPTQDGVDGYTTFLVTFNPDEMPNGSASGITNYTGTYSYVVAPDNGAVSQTPTPISRADRGVGHRPGGPAGHQRTGNTTAVPIPTWGPGGSGTGFDQTTSTINLSGFDNQTITGLTVNLSITDPLNPPGLGNDGDLFIELTAL